MKKTKSLLGLAVLVLSAGALVACGETDKPAESSAKCKHDWVDTIIKEATCSEEGIKDQKCSKCGEEKKDVKISKKAHTYVEQEAQAVAPSCTEEGKKVEKCSVCEDEKVTTIEALGHDFGETSWDTQPDCEHEGHGTQHCSRCEETQEVTQAALGHKFVTVDDAEPAPGKAKVRVYTCENGCGQTNLGFKASEVTEASKLADPAVETDVAGLVIDADGGATFWGRPQGNRVALDENGTADQNDHPAAYDPTIKGNYFEYVFDLTAAEVATLGTAQRLYCEAKAANYLSQDFWANDDPTAEEWTPGFYTQGENAGEQIRNYRYILYVDDVPQEFDPDISVRVTDGMNPQKREYMMPFTFHLHAGENKIRLVMAGGYRSTFYNFTFRPFQES